MVYIGTKKQCEGVLKVMTKKLPPLICAVSNTISSMIPLAKPLFLSPPWNLLIFFFFFFFFFLLSVIHDEKVLKLVDCLAELCSKSDPLRNLCCKVLSLPLGDKRVLVCRYIYVFVSCRWLFVIVVWF